MKQIKTKLFPATRSVAQRGTVAILCTFLFGLFLISGCKKDNSNTVKEPEYPIEIPFTEYNLPKTCQWKNLNYDNSVIIINNDEELQQHITSIDGIYPEIDFTTHTLLVTSGKTDFKVAKKTISKLQQLSESEYELDVEIFMDGTEASYQWAVSTITEKVKEESKVKLNITCDKSDYPVEIPFTEYSLRFKCMWKNLDYNDMVVIINSDEEMSQYVKCLSGNYDEIDFSKHSLLLLSGKTDFEIMKTTVADLQQFSEKEYELNMEILLYDESIGEEWEVALIVEKVSRDCNVKLNVTEYHPIENIPFKEYYVHFWPDMFGKHPCWINLNHDENSPDFIFGIKLSVVNSNEDLETFLICPEDYPAIDSSKYTLLIASGLTPSGGSKIGDIGFFKYNSNQFALRVIIRTGITNDRGLCIIAILVPKIDNEESVVLKAKSQ